MPGLNIYLGSFLVLAAGVIGALAITTCLNVFRLRNKRMNWRVGTLKGFPLFSTLFLGISSILVGVMWAEGGFWSFVASLLYFFIAASWFISSYFSSKCYVTDNGIVKNVNDPSQTIPWHQMRDFLEREQSGYTVYTFMYSTGIGKEIRNLQRLELRIPPKKYESFKKLLSHKLGRRISCYDDSTIGAENFE